MIEIYIPLEDAARAEGIKYNTLVQRIKRDPSSFAIREEENPSGGKPLKLVALSSLSVKARKAYKAAQKIGAAQQTGGGDAVDNDTIHPWYVDADPRWFIENHGQEYYRAVELKNQIERLLDYDEPNRTTYTVSHF